VKGEISGAEDLLIDGSVEGVVRLSEGQLTIGPAARLTASITARDVLVRGNVKGNVCAKGRIEIGNEASVTGDLRMRQVFIESGAWFKGSLEVEKSTVKQSARTPSVRQSRHPLRSGQPPLARRISSLCRKAG